MLEVYFSDEINSFRGDSKITVRSVSLLTPTLGGIRAQFEEPVVQEERALSGILQTMQEPVNH